MTVSAGSARRDVTPDRSVRLAGHASRTTPSEGVASPLMVRVVCLEHKELRLAVVVADVLWWGTALADAVRADLARQLGTGVEAVWVVGTHTHNAPQTATTLAPSLGPYDGAFAASLASAAAEACEEAAASLTPVTLRLGEAECDIGVYRRRLIDGEIRMAPDPAVPVDRSLRVASLETHAGPVATLVQFACHPTTSGENRVSADYPGAAARRLDRELGGTTLFLQGCAGDVRPQLTGPDGSFRLGDEAEVDRLGGQLTDAVHEALASAVDSDWGVLRAAAAVAPLSLANGGQVDLALGALFLADELLLLGMNVEPVSGYGRRIRNGWPQVWPVGYTNGILAYLPTDQQLAEGGYEAVGSVPHFALPAPFAPGTEATVMGAVDQLLKTVAGEDSR